jgi:2-haloacid dehalogenase
MKAYDNLSTFPDVKPALEAIAARSDIECVVFSNGTKSMVTNSVHSSSALSPHAKVFSGMVTADVVKAFKPAPEVYQHLAQETNMVGNESNIWLVSGNPFDVVGARAMGMQAAWVDRDGNGWADRLGDEPTVVVKGLGEVVEAAEKWSQK